MDKLGYPTIPKELYGDESTGLNGPFGVGPSFVTTIQSIRQQGPPLFKW